MIFAEWMDNMATNFKTDPISKTNSPTSVHQQISSSTKRMRRLEIDCAKYIGIVMSLMFLDRCTWTIIPMPVTFLATKSADPRQRDYNKAIKILNYAVHTKSRYLLFKNDSDLQLVAYSDAPDMRHSDAEGLLLDNHHIRKNYRCDQIVQGETCHWVIYWIWTRCCGRIGTICFMDFLKTLV